MAGSSQSNLTQHIVESAILFSTNLLLSSANWWLFPLFIARSVNLPALRQLSPAFNSYAGSIEEERAAMSYFRVLANVLRLAEKEGSASLLCKELIMPNLASIVHSILEKLTWPDSSIRVLALDSLATLELCDCGKTESSEVTGAEHLQLQRARAMMLSEASSLHLIAQQHMSARLAGRYSAQSNLVVLTAVQAYMHFNCRKYSRWLLDPQQPYISINPATLIRWVMPWFRHVDLQTPSSSLRTQLIDSLFALSFNPNSVHGIPEISDM